MNFLQKKLMEISDQLPPAVFRLMSAIFDRASQADNDKARWSAPKGDVLQEIEKSESKQPSGEVVRQRLQTFKSLMEQSPGWMSADIPLIAVRSTKSKFEITTNLEFINAQERQKTKSAITKSGHDDYRSHLGPIEPVEPRFAIPTYSVFVSHHWEGDKRDDILDEFIEMLSKSLRKLPAKWSGKFKVDIVYDRAGAFHGRDRFQKQSDELCEKSSFGLFMASNGWCQSGACQKEAAHFANQTSVGESYLVIQFVNVRDELDPKWIDCPNLPSYRKEWQTFENLIELWDSSISTREKFVHAIRDEICEFLEMNGGDTAPPKTERSFGKQQKMGSLRERKIKLDTPAEKQVEALMHAEEGGDNTETTPDGVSAVQTLYDWATDGEAKNRTVILLGGFGMGKTTTVQMLHERLYQDVSTAENTPVPVYLDFRRLIPQTEHGKPLNISRDEMIAAALHPDVVSQVGQEGISDMIRNENCLLIFDGLDEVGNRVGREHAAQLYRQFLELIPSDVQVAEAESGSADWTRCRTRLIVTCRTHFFRSVRELNSVFCGAHRRASSDRSFHGRQIIPCTRIYHMAPLTFEQIEELFTKYLGSELGTETMRLIRGIHDLPGLAQRPIMARFISEVAGELIKIHEAGQPINIATIYDELFQLGLERDAEKRPLLKPNDREEMLVSLAAHLHSNALGPQSADDLEKWFDSFALSHDGIRMILASGQVNCRDLLHTELENASFLVRDEGDTFRFAHTSYYEYFLALAIAQCKSAEAFSKLMDRQASSETYEFVYAIVEKEGLGQKLTEIWKDVVCALDAESGVRVSALQLIATAKDWDIPQGANLSNFGMKNFRFAEGATLRNVDFSEAELIGMDARNVIFNNCSFGDANIANGTFENCGFENCRGVPKGLVSARGIDTSLPKEWSKLVAERGRYWRKRTDPGAARLVVKNMIQSVAFSPDGKQILTGSYDNTARVWDAKSGAEILKLEGHGSRVQSVAFSPDGKQILTGADDNTARVWDAKSGAEVLKLEGHGRAVHSVAFSPDGKQILTGSYDNTAGVWDAKSGAEILKLEGHGRMVRSVAFSPDGKQILTGADDGTARVWDAKSGAEIFACVGLPESWAVLSPDGSISKIGPNFWRYAA